MADDKKTDVKKGFWQRLFDTLDRKMEEKARRGGCCCCSSALKKPEDKGCC